MSDSTPTDMPARRADHDSTTPEPQLAGQHHALGQAAARRLLRYELEVITDRAGVTHAEMGERLGMSRASFSQMLAGKSLPSQPALEVMANHLGQGHRLPRLIELAGIARKAKPQNTLRLVADGELACGLTAYATDITVVDTLTVAALAQTRAYTRALLAARLRHDLDLDEAVDLLHNRHTAVTADNPARLRYYADELALRRRVGDHQTMADQYDHLLALADLPHVSLHVIPTQFTTGATAARAPFHLYTYNDITVAHHETPWQAHYDHSLTGTDECKAFLDNLHNLAHDEHRSRDLIHRLRTSL